MAVGRFIGRLAYHFAPRRRHITEANIRVCFPELSETDQTALVKKHFQSLGMALIETGMAWWLSKKELLALCQVEGMEHLQRLQDEGKGVLLLSAHFTSLELGNRMMTDVLPDKLDAMYQAHKHPFKEHVISHYRNIHMGHMIPESDARQVVKLLRNGGVVWYASDQGYNDKNAVLAPFFGEPAMSNTALTRLLKISGATVVPFFVQRMENGNHWLLRLQAPVEEMPGESELDDVIRYHQLIEEQTRRAPEQYLWSHRRFKKRPADYPDIYADK